MGTHVCPWWLAYSFDNPLRRMLHDPERLLAPFVSRGATVLDVGCGMGFFSLGLARIVGEEGTVIAADLQPEMLAKTAARARRAGLAGRIQQQLCTPTDLGLASRQVDFILAFWMVHEVPDATSFFRQLRSSLRPAGRILVAEPRIHVPERRFQEVVAAARAAGLRPCGAPRVAASRSVLLELGPDAARTA
jgi:ubiquinone/menaquinone biosynthesis C-methylase UbiE